MIVNIVKDMTSETFKNLVHGTDLSGYALDQIDTDQSIIAVTNLTNCKWKHGYGNGVHKYSFFLVFKGVSSIAVFEKMQ